MKVIIAISIIFSTTMLPFIIMYRNEQKSKNRKKYEKEQKLIDLMRHFEGCDLTQGSNNPTKYYGSTDFGKITINTAPDEWYVEIWYKGQFTMYREMEATKFITLFI